MRYSKSILAFLFISSTTSAFYYALKRTNGNVYVSIMFTIHYILFEAGLMEPITYKVEPPQLNPPDVVKTGVLPNYINLDGDYDRPPRVYIGETKMGTLTFQHPRSASSIAELRAGSRSEDFKQAVGLLVMLWYGLRVQQAYGFGVQPLPNQVQMPHLEAANNILFGKPKPNPLFSRQISRFDPQESSPYSLKVISK
uniref:Uncharacterized protein n=1 Tax=Cylindrotheca closterium TaxID=2856 RepID=A0A023HC77_9STRA|nr:hypothetical protein [Cylindrotheca closterium]AGH28542.1 hypothetical protein [Cylindrotheca closterium]